MTVRLEIKQLRMIIELVAKDGVTAAATDLGLTPSALSHRLREAERRLGFPLFERQGHRLHLTPAGERIHRAASEIFTILTEAEKQASDIANGYSHTLKVGSRAYSCYRWLPSFLNVFREQHGHVMVELLDGTIAGPLDALRNHSIDVLILSGSPSTTGISLYPLFQDHLIGILPPDHAATQKKWLEASDFVDELYVTYSTTPEPGHEYELFFRNTGVLPRRILRAGLTEAIVELVHHAYGFSILANWAVRPYLANGYIAGKPLTAKGLDVTWAAAVRADERPTSLARTFAQSLSDWCQTQQAMIGYTIKP